MNILNLSYFTKDEFNTIINNIYDCLELDGLFVTGSNQDAGTRVNGAIYKKTSDGFNLIHCEGSGSIIKEQIENIK